MSAAEYVRTIEHHVCQKNDGHLIRIVGPSFEVVSRWERDGVPLKVALRGIDQYFERYYRDGPRRRPVRVEFCDTDVREVFDQWRRAVGVTAGTAPAAGDGSGQQQPSARGGPSLPAHLERVLLKLTAARATGRLGAEADAWIDRVAGELDEARAAARGLRGDARRSLLDRLIALDRALIEAVVAAMSEADRQRLASEADDELAAYRDRLAPEAYARARQAIADRLVRERAGLPVIVFL